MPPLLRRTLASLAAWTVGAVVAVSVGVLALSAIGDGWASGAPQPLLPASTGEIVASPTAAPPSSRSVRSTPVPRTPTEYRTLTGHGGTVEAQCTGTIAYLASWSPGQGYQVDDVHRGPAALVWVKFGGAGREHVLRVRCAGGIPQIDTSWRGGGDD